MIDVVIIINNINTYTYNRISLLAYIINIQFLYNSIYNLHKIKIPQC